MEFISKSVQDTIEFAKEYASTLKEGDVVALIGDLGAGKTTFTKALCDALGYSGEVTSPTFTLVNEYQGRLKIYHFDMYRLNTPDEAIDSGLDEILRAGEGVCVVEWPQNLGRVLPKCKAIKITKIGEFERKFVTEENYEYFGD